MEEIIKLPNGNYVILKNAASFSIEKHFEFREEEVIKGFLCFKFEDFEIVKAPVWVFIVNGQTVYETFEDDSEGMKVIEHIKECIANFVKKEEKC